MATPNVIKTLLTFYDPSSGHAQFAPDSAEPEGTGHITVPTALGHSAGASSLKTLGFSPKGSVYYLIDITDPELPRIVGTEPISDSAPRGVGTAVKKSIIPPGACSLVKTASQLTGEALNNSFRSSGDDVLKGIHNNGSTSTWGASYGHTLGHSFIKASEMASVQTFTYDELTRIKGTNLQVWTALGERDVATSGHTSTETVQETHLIHESLGRNQKTDKYGVYSGFTKKDDAKASSSILGMTEDEYLDYQTAAKEEGEVGATARYKIAAVRQRYEQWQQDHPKLLARHVKLNGYLGHGEIDQVVKATAVDNHMTATTATPGSKTGLPDETDFNNEYISQHTTAKIPSITGLSEIQRASDGRVRITSAKSLSLVKEINIPVPVQVATNSKLTPEAFLTKADQIAEAAITDPQESTELFDRKELYNRAMDRRCIDKHPEWTYPSIQEQGTDKDSTEYNGNILDNAIAFNKKGTSDASGVDYTPGALNTHTYEIPAHVTMEVDEQTKSKYYKGRAGVFITEDGGIVIRDAYGSSIRMTGGNIYADCPGDILEMPGRDKVTIAGRNASLQAQQDVEVVSAIGNTRIKAHNQLSMLGGAAGTGGVLIENQATGTPSKAEGKKMSSAGISIKSTSHVSISAAQLGIKAETAIKSTLAVTGSIFAPLVYGATVHTPNLVAVGNLHGKASTAGRAEFAQNSSGHVSDGSSPANVAVINDKTGSIETNVNGGNGFTAAAPTTKFSFNSSKEYGLELSNYKFELIEPIWQSRERIANVPKTPWKLNKTGGAAVDFQQPYPGNALLTTKTLKQPKVADTFRTTWKSEEDPTKDAFTSVAWADNFRVNSGLPTDE